MKKSVFLLAMALLLLWSCPFSQASELPPIPPMPKKFKDITIAKADPSVPKDIAEFLGEWEGIWKYMGERRGELNFGADYRKARIIVFEVTPTKVKFLYGCGESPYDAGPIGWSKHESEITEEFGRKCFSRRSGSGFRMTAYLENGVLKTGYSGVMGEFRRIS
jgi:hypothetical protein